MLKYEYQPNTTDLNHANHIDNARIYEWLSEHRWKYFDSLDVFDERIKPFLATIRLDFKRELFHQNPVTITTSLYKLGSKSLTTEQKIFQDGELCVTCEGVSVCFDANEKQTLVIPDRIRKALENELQ